MLVTTIRLAAIAAIAATWLGGCAVEHAVDSEIVRSTQDTLGASDAGDAAVTDANAEDAGPEINLCIDDLDRWLTADCDVCAQTHCAAEDDGCQGTCRGLISCAAESCSGSGLSCVLSNCGQCSAGGGPAVTWAGCMQDHCAESCPFVARLPQVPSTEPPPPPPSDECHDDLPGTLGEACTACLEEECSAERASCDESCRSLITCVIGTCDRDLGCVLTHCNSCLGDQAPVEAVGACLVSRCAAECPLPGTPDAGTPPEEPVDAGDAACDESAGHGGQHKPHKPHKPRNR